jgi:hypothetical protein
MNYQEAKEIRQTRLRDLISENLVSGDTNIKESFKKAISDKSKAKVKGIKETFDPLNIAKFLTGGSKLGPALLGRLTGRSQEDINYFTDTPNKKVNKVDEKETPILGILNKIYTFMNKNYQDDIKRRELENNYLEEKALEEKKRHDILLKTLKDLMKRIASSQKGGKEKEPEPESGNGIMDSFRDLIGKRVAKALVAVGAGVAAEKAGKKVLEKSIGKTAEKVTGEVAKEVGKEAAEKATKEKIEKSVSGKLSKFIFSSSAKKIPIAGAIIGGIFGLKKLYEGDRVGAGLEVASGAAGTIPIAGTAASLGIDAVGLARDVYKEVYNKFPEEEREVAKQRMQQIAAIIEEFIKSKTSSDKDKAETKDKNDAKDVPLKEIPKENATTTLATTDSKSSDSTSQLSASDSEVGNTTTPLSMTESNVGNITTPLSATDILKGDSTTTPLSASASESKSSSVSSPQTMADILKSDDTTDLVKSDAIRNATATQMSTLVPSITKSGSASSMGVDNTKQTSLKLNQEEKTPVGLPLQETINQNQNLNIQNSNIKNTSKPNQINITNPAPQDKTSSIIPKYIFPVRNPEETFRTMIFNSTRVV